jgi:Flp pilus assembly protein TadG
VTGQRARGQSLVELALVAPILILMAMSAWDGGSVLREQVVLQQAARDGARVAATGYGQSVSVATICSAVAASAANLSDLTCALGNITYPTVDTVQVRLTYAHALVTPVLRQLWAGGLGTMTLTASATFYLPQLTPVPATIVPTGPTATPTLVPTATSTATPTRTATPTPTVTPTRTPTPAPSFPCSGVPNSAPIPALASNQGYWCSIAVAASSYVAADWQDNNDPNNQIAIYQASPGPFAGQPDPLTASPPNGNLATDFQSNGVLWGTTTACQAPGNYAVYFFNQGARLQTTTQADVFVIAC